MTSICHALTAASSQLLPAKNVVIWGSPNASTNRGGGVFLSRDGYELQCIAGDLVSLTTLEVTLMGKDLDEDRLVRCDSVDIYERTIAKRQPVRC
jgi:hypothetical protein